MGILKNELKKSTLKEMNGIINKNFKNNKAIGFCCRFISKANGYSFLVMFFLIACSEIILEKDIADKSVVLLSPGDSSSIKSLTPSFWWEEVEGASNYEIQIVSPSFENPIRLFVDSIVSNNKFTIDLDTLQFQWRVRAINGGYKSNYSTATFSIDSGSVIQDRALNLLAPANSSFHKNQEIELKWEGATGAEKYNLVVEGDTSIDINLANTITSSKIRFGVNKNFTWKVIPINAPQYKESEKYSFGIDNKAPATPALSAPNDNIIISTETATFTWTSSDENLSKNTLLIYDEAGNSILSSKDAGLNNSLQVTKEDLGTSGSKRQWAIRSVDKAGNEAISSKRNFSIQ